MGLKLRNFVFIVGNTREIFHPLNPQMMIHFLLIRWVIRYPTITTLLINICLNFMSRQLYLDWKLTPPKNTLTEDQYLKIILKWLKHTTGILLEPIIWRLMNFLLWHKNNSNFYTQILTSHQAIKLFLQLGENQKKRRKKKWIGPSAINVKEDL